MTAARRDSNTDAVDAEISEKIGGVEHHDDNASEYQNAVVDGVAPVYSTKGSFDYAIFETLSLSANSEADQTIRDECRAQKN